MSKNFYNLRTDINKAKSYGSSGHGLNEWIIQRVTAILMIPLALWFLNFLLEIRTFSFDEIVKELKKIYNLVPAVMLSINSLYHGMLGIYVILEDYIKCFQLRLLLKVSIKIITYLTIMSLVLTLIILISRG